MKVGDKVEVLDEAIKGVVLALRSDKVVILTEDDFEMEFSRNELIIDKAAVPRSDFIPDNISQVLS